MKTFYSNRLEQILNHKKTRPADFLTGTAALVFLLLFCFPAATMGRTVDRIIAIVNGEALTYSELDMAVRQARIGLLGFSPDESDLEGELFERNVLSRLIDQTIQLQMARKGGISVEPREIDLALEDVMKNNGMTSNDQLKAAIGKEGLTLDQYRESLREQISIIKLMNRE
ncbi:MAG TPA: SurA N-terminal domain-containing protein, partial [Nitrospiria bacterium]|nr:SurA N-terminal domain-containing protein [Nitrospiria bacterium]